MSINLNDIINYGTCKFKVVKPATTEDIRNIQNQLNEKIDINNDFTIIYPNGGTAQNPATITKYSVYVCNNPFPGYYVFCIAELYYDNQWIPVIGPMDDYGSGANSWSCTVAQLNDSNIQLLTGRVGLVIESNSIIKNLRIDGTPTPCRVKVWKIGKIN